MFEYEIAAFRRNELIREAAAHRLAKEAAEAGRRRGRKNGPVATAGVAADRRSFTRAA
ncbi:hypothetical protein [Streptomyces sp. NPDC089919]|uniref:hypothetical protein n=1 Tax=Streptomyces sp. NPDC089919 TaxID=3155188 RepID=UPI003436E4B4